MNKERVVDINIENVNDANSIIQQMAKMGGFAGRHLAEGVDILEEMIKDSGCLKILTFPACIVASGLRGVLVTLAKMRLFDIIITTCGTLDHDIARCYANYYKGSFDSDDSLLYKQGIHRLGNIFVPKNSYGLVIERKVLPFLNEIYQRGYKELASYELCRLLAKVTNKSSLLYWTSKNEIPVIIPGIYDGAVGTQIWMFQQKNKEFKVNLKKDEDLLLDLIFRAKRLGALIIGGGISKHHALWWSQFKDGLDYGVYITTAVEYDGSLSGARLKEAISWGKVKDKARHLTVFADATCILPFMISALLQRIKK
jgi:deoxyhypusine synthase